MKVLHVDRGATFTAAPGRCSTSWRVWRGSAWTTCSPAPGAHIAEPARAHARVFERAMKGDADIGLALRLKRLIRAQRPDLVHLHSRRGADLWGGVGASSGRRACVLSRRVDNPESRWLVAAKYRLYDHVITISEGIREVLLAEGLAPHKGELRAQRGRCTALSGQLRQTGLACQARARAGYAACRHGGAADRAQGHRHLLAALPDVLSKTPRTARADLRRGPLEAELRQAILDQGCPTMSA